MRIRTVALYATAFLIWMLGSVGHAANDPFTGTWNLDLQASKGGARSQVLTIEVTGNRETYRSELTLPDGTRQVTNYTAAYDQREYPSETSVTQPNGAVVRHEDSVILKKIDLRTRERQWKRDGRVIRILRRNVSSDGHTLMSRVIDIDATGHEHVVGTLLFNRR